MTQPRAEMQDIQNTWFFMRFFIWVGSKATALYEWLTQHREDYPANEAGELMRRQMENKSWFDEISSGWVEQPFFKKTVFITGLSLLAGLIGLLVGAPILLPLSALFTSLFVHVLLVSHETNRWEGAKILAKQTIELNETLNASVTYFETATSMLNSSTEKLNAQSNELQGHADVLNDECKKIHQTNDALIIMVDEVKASTDNLLTEEAAATKHFKTMAVDLEKGGETITGIIEKVESTGAAFSQFSGTVSEIQQSQIAFSEAVNHFSFFVSKTALETTAAIGLDHDQELDENDAIIEEMKRLMIKT